MRCQTEMKEKQTAGDQARIELCPCLCAVSEFPQGLEVHAIRQASQGSWWLGGSFNMARVGCSVLMSVFTLNFISFCWFGILL